VLALGVVVAGVVIALLQPAPANGYLDPNGTSPTGSRALADLLTARGQQVVRVTAPPSASAAPGSLELITGAGSLTKAQLVQAGRFNGDILLVASGDVTPSESHAADDAPDALRAIAPAVHFAGYEPATVAEPACTAQAAALSGAVYFYGAVLRSTAPAAQSCYPAGDGYSLVSYRDGARTITVLGSSAPLSNAYLSAQGDAALTLNLLRSARQVVWVVPSPQAQATTAPGQRSFFSLVPWPAYLVAIQLCVAVLLAAAWRARRLGPLVAERLPVIVRAAETVEGHGRLYQARRARDRAAAELRAAASARIAQVTGGSATPEAIEARTGLPAEYVAVLLHGPPPPTDQALVTLAAELDTLERKIRQS
jgi:hypothetical protein